MLLVINTLLLPYILINYAISYTRSISILGDIQNPAGHGPEQPALASPAQSWAAGPRLQRTLPTPRLRALLFIF